MLEYHIVLYTHLDFVREPSVHNWLHIVVHALEEFCGKLRFFVCEFG